MFILKQIKKSGVLFLSIFFVAQSCTYNNTDFQGKDYYFKQGKVHALNRSLKKYDELNTTKKDQVISEVIQNVREHKEDFEKKLQRSGSTLDKINLILGTKGSGNSTLFNYLNGYPLEIIERNNKAKLDVDKSKLTDDQQQMISPIQHCCISKNSMLNLGKSCIINTVYVDYPVNTENNDILQCIINSYLKNYLSENANHIKLTLTFNYVDFMINDDKYFNRLLKKTTKSIGNLDAFIESKSISMVATNFLTNLPKECIPCFRDIILQSIRKHGQAPEKLKLIYSDILSRKAMAIFLKPANDIINIDEICKNRKKGIKIKSKYGIPHGSPYTPEGIGSLENITSTLEKTTKFLNNDNKKHKIFTNNLPYKAQKIIEDICSHLSISVQDEITKIITKYICNNSTNENILNIILAKISSIENKRLKDKLKNTIIYNSEANYLDILIDELKINKYVSDKYIHLTEDLREFFKLSKSHNSKEKIWEVREKIILLVQKKLESITNNKIKIEKDKKRKAEVEIKEKKYKKMIIESKKMIIESKRRMAEVERKIAQSEIRNQEAERKMLEIKKRIAKADRRDAEVERKIAQSEIRNQETERKMLETKRRIAKANKKDIEVEKRIAKAELKYKKAETRIIEATIKNIEVEKKIKKTKIIEQEAKRRIIELEEKITEVERKIAESKIKNTELDKRNKKIEAKNAEIEEKITYNEMLEYRLKRLNKNIDNKLNQIKEKNNKPTSINISAQFKFSQEQ